MPENFIPLIYTEVTTCCQNKCQCCPRTTSVSRSNFVDVETRKKVVEFLSSFPDQKFIVMPHLLGEPLIYKELESYIQELQALPNTAVILCTNGLLLNNTRIDSLLKAGLKNIWFSMHGITEVEYQTITNTDNYELARSNFLNLICRRGDFDRVHVVTFSSSWLELEPVIRASLISTQTNRPILKWEMDGSLERQICISTEGDITWTWQDYRFEQCVGNIKFNAPRDVFNAFASLREEYIIDHSNFLACLNYE